MKIIPILLFLFPAAAVAQSYFGGSVGYGVTEDYRPKQIRHQHLTEDQTTTSATAGLFAGYRFGMLGAEVGAVMLPRMQGSSSTDNYWAYKGAPVGSYPKTIQLQQTIRGESFYARAQVYGPSVFGMTPYAFGGVAYTITRNREWGVYDGKDEVEHRATYSTIRPVFGFGLQTSGRVFGRVEYLRVNKASDEYHVRKRDVSMVSVGLGIKF